MEKYKLNIILVGAILIGIGGFLFEKSNYINHKELKTANKTASVMKDIDYLSAKEIGVARALATTKEI